MKKLLLLLLFAGLLNTGSVFGWGREGHETIAKIAERNLTKKAKKRIEKYLGGHSIVYFAKWMDEYRHTPEYKFTNNWHTVPVNAGLRYEDSMLATGGNAIYGLEQAIENLKNYRSLTDSAVEVNLKYIIHLVGDMHCPAHIKYTTHDTKYDVLFEDKYHKPHKFPIHSVWDNEIITVSRIWSVSEWADELDRLPKSDKQAIADRVAQIRAQIGVTTSEYDKEKLQERLAKLAGGVAVIKVGAATETEMKEKKLRIEDALNATRAAVEEGIVAGGGTAYVVASKAAQAAAAKLSGDEKTGANMIATALRAPICQIAANAGVEGAVILDKVSKSKNANFGYDAAHDTFGDMIENGIVDPTKVCRSALENAASVSSMVLTTESLVADLPEKAAPAAPAAPDMGGMY